jgi:hypothetical protein
MIIPCFIALTIAGASFYSGQTVMINANSIVKIEKSIHGAEIAVATKRDEVIVKEKPLEIREMIRKECK